MLYDLFYISQGKIDENEWKKFHSRFPLARKIENVKSLNDIKSKSFTKFFWVIWDDLEIIDDSILDYRVTEWDENYVHIFKNGLDFDGICIIPKSLEISDREFFYRWFKDKKEIDIVASKPKPYDVFVIDSYEEYLNALENSKTELFWMISRNLKIVDDFNFDFYFSYWDRTSRSLNHSFAHKVDSSWIDEVRFTGTILNDNNSPVDLEVSERTEKILYNAVHLLSKHKPVSKKEIDFRFLLEKTEWDIIVSEPLKYNKFSVENYEDYLRAMEESKTEMFWMTSPNIDTSNFDFNIYFTHDQTYERKINHAFIHRVEGRDFYNGLFLMSKHKPVTKREIEYRHLVEVKEWNLVASGPVKYDIFEIETYEEYKAALELSKTEMFWMTSPNIDTSNFNFDLYFVHNEQYYERHTNHAFVHRVNNVDTYNGLFLMSKYSPVSKKEIEHRHLINYKEWNIVASGPVKYDIFEIETYDDYLRAIEESKTEMFWMTSPNLDTSDFKFDVYFSHNQQFERSFNHSFIHRANGRDSYNGVHLLSKRKPVSKKEIDFRFLIEKREWSIVASGPIKYDIFEIETYDDYLRAMENSKTEMFWMTSSNLDTNNFKFDVYFSHDQQFERSFNHSFIHQIDESWTIGSQSPAETRDSYTGVHLLSKRKPVSKKEIDFRFLIEKTEWSTVASVPRIYDIFEIETYDDYLRAMENSKTEMFWMTSPNIDTSNFNFKIHFPYYQEYERKENHAFGHKVDNNIFYNGVFLISKKKPVSKKEIEFRHLINHKEWSVVASGPKSYDRFIIKDYEDYLKAKNESKTEMFWLIPNEVEILDNFKFDLYFTHDNNYDRSVNHVFKHIFRGEEIFTGVILSSKKKEISKKEINFRHLIEKKEHNITASKLKPYEIVFISYDEIEADNTYQRLLEKYPTAKRIHGVKGIHQAHIEAAKIVNTDMFWVVDADAEIAEDFYFQYEVSRYELDCVHVWRSKNPVNDLIYGYGGVKLLPTYQTLNMDLSKPDMTTSISRNFKAMPQISNITKFNTDPFNTWKSAFRECVKLSSKIIDRQSDKETLSRLDIWCNIGEDRPYGNYAIDGARAGREYGETYKNDLAALARINDFIWLKAIFDER